MKPKRERFNCLDCERKIFRKDLEHSIQHPFCDICHLHHYGRKRTEKEMELEIKQFLDGFKKTSA